MTKEMTKEMTSIKNTFWIMAIAILTIGCGGDDSPQTDPVQAVIDGLGKTWKATSVSVTNDDVTSQWTAFTLTLDPSKGYKTTSKTTESLLIWPASGSYSFPDATNPKKLLRSDDVEMLVSNLTETTATLTFTISGSGGRSGGRDEGLAGEWVFAMTTD